MIREFQSMKEWLGTMGRPAKAGPFFSRVGPT
jgi:hypothetical protein